jgi:hypothetical protein
VNLRRTCEALLNYLKLGGMRLCGISYGSDKLLTNPDASQELYKRILQEYSKRTGERCPFKLHEVLDAYGQCRKGNYKALRDGQPIQNEPDLPLFGKSVKGPTAVLYAYLGHNARQKRRLIKIGYTSQDLTTYLKSKVIQHDPQLLASRCGGIEDEHAEHVRWDRILADGREWFFATTMLLDAMRREWDVTDNFEELAEQALKEAGIR